MSLVTKDNMNSGFTHKVQRSFSMQMYNARGERCVLSILCAWVRTVVKRNVIGKRHGRFIKKMFYSDCLARGKGL